MSVSVIATKIASSALLLPLNVIIVALAGLILRRRGVRRAGTALVGAAAAVLMILSTVAGAMLLVAPLERQVTPLTSPHEGAPQAIVVLGGGRIATAPEYGGHDQPLPIALARLRYAARLQHQTGLPVVTSGGSPVERAESEAAGMARVLREDFAVQAVWPEENSRNTAENAAFTAQMLRDKNVGRVLLVTDAIHMPRALFVFRQAGLEAIPAPTLFYTFDRRTALHFIPGAEGLKLSNQALHEWIGLIWYRVAFRP